MVSSILRGLSHFPCLNINYQPMGVAFLSGWDQLTTEFVSRISAAAPKTPNEELSTVADWGGAGCWGRMINQNYARASVALAMQVRW